MSRSRGAEESALTSLAILKVNHDQDRDYISNFIPFVAEVLRDCPDDEVSLAQVQNDVDSQFSIKIPQGALSTILHRASKLGYVTRTHGIYRRNANELAKVKFGSVRADVARKQAALLRELREFANEKYDLAWEVLQAEVALLSYLSTRTTAVLTAAMDGKAIDAPPPTDHAELIVNAFVVEASRSNPTGFEFLVTLVKGGMLADVLYLPGAFAAANRKFGETEFYLDTAFVLRAIGFSTKEMSMPAHELVGLLQDENVHLRVFEHTREEMIVAMDYASRALKPGSSLPLSAPAEFLRSEGWRSSDVEEFIAKLPLKLSALGIEVVSTPPFTEVCSMDEEGLENAIKETLPEQKNEARRRDVDSLTAIHRLRRGRVPDRLEDCGAIFVSSNGALVRAGTKFFRREMPKIGISPVIHAHDLTTLAWLKLPTAPPDLPRLQIIADSYAALNPSEELWQKYTRKITKLRERGDVSTEEFHLLRYSIEARRALLAKTLGDPDVFTEGTVPVILAKARKELTAGLREELEDERVAKEKQEEIARNAKAGERAASEAAQEHLAEVRSDADAKEERRRSAILGRAEAVARVATGLGFVLAAIIICLGTALASGQLLPSSWRDALPGLVWIPTLCVGLLSVVNLIFGTSLVDLSTAVRRRITAQIVSLLTSATSD
jgi:hypothetical protein